MDVLGGFITNNLLRLPTTKSGQRTNPAPLKIHTDFSITFQRFMASLADELGNRELLRPTGNSSSTWR
jgi:hypothetical protein